MPLSSAKARLLLAELLQNGRRIETLGVQLLERRKRHRSVLGYVMYRKSDFLYMLPVACREIMLFYAGCWGVYRPGISGRFQHGCGPLDRESNCIWRLGEAPVLSIELQGARRIVAAGEAMQPNCGIIGGHMNTLRACRVSSSFLAWSASSTTWHRNGDAVDSDPACRRPQGPGRWRWASSRALPKPWRRGSNFTPGGVPTCGAGAAKPFVLAGYFLSTACAPARAGDELGRRGSAARYRSRRQGCAPRRAMPWSPTPRQPTSAAAPAMAFTGRWTTAARWAAPCSPRPA